MSCKELSRIHSMIQTGGYTDTADLILVLSYFNTKISMTYKEETLSLKTMLIFSILCEVSFEGGGGGVAGAIF